jgi:uncharacterized protein (DUF1800 family)
MASDYEDFMLSSSTVQRCRRSIPQVRMHIWRDCPMAVDTRTQVALASHRFGFSPKSGALASAGDPREMLIAELGNPAAGQIKNNNLLSSGEAARAAFDFRQERKATQLAIRTQGEPNAERPKGPPADAPQLMTREQANQPKPNPGPGVPQQIYLEEAKSRLDAALDSDVGFVERLVWFWSNHFCVSADKGGVRPLCGAFEREAIRLYVRGKFADMLIAVESHPAMLLYLDNARSIGPDSFAGLRRNKGLNENLAREILELHTLGVRTGYSQDDVTTLAKVITGWSIVPPRLDSERGGEFLFNPRLHEPGPQRIMGREYQDNGFEQGRAVLLALARSPATAKHIATKLARHFVADDPPLTLVDRLAKRFLTTDGDLKEVAKTLVLAPEAWDAPRNKLRRPSEWLVSALRATGLKPPDVRPVLQAQNLLGEPLWRVPAPNGFSDNSAAWMDGLAQRLDISNQIARRAGASIDPDALAEDILGPLLSNETKQTLARAESRPQALALLLMAPEFQRR